MRRGRHRRGAHEVLGLGAPRFVRVFVENARAASHDFDRNRFIIFSPFFFDEEFFLLLSPSYRAPPTEHSLRPCDLH